jgi:hypothetical protein
LPALNIIKPLAIISIALTSCFDFEFESPYEDINGIYLEHVQSYDYSGTKLLLVGNVGYLISNDSMQMHDFTDVDSIFLLNVYQASYDIRDFDIAGAYAFLACGGLEIVDRDYSQPYLVGSLSLDYAYEIRVFDDYAYLASGPFMNVIDIVDVADKSNQLLVNSISFSYAIRHFEVDSNFLYVLLYANEFHIIDVTEPISPSAVYVLPNTDTMKCVSFTVRDDYIYLSCIKGIPKLITYRVLDDNELAMLSEISCPSDFIHMHATACYGLALTGTPYIILLSLEHPAAPSISETISINAIPAYGIIEDNYIYVLSPFFTPFLAIIEIKDVE